MLELPTGYVTVLLTDIEGSSKLWAQHEPLMSRAIARHDEIALAAFAAYRGHLINRQAGGDSLFCVFADPLDALECAYALQSQWLAEEWQLPEPLKVRIGIHSGFATLRAGDYYGTTINRCARLRDIGHGGQILVSGAIWEQVQFLKLPHEIDLLDKGVHFLKDLQEPERVYQLMHPILPLDFPSLRSLNPERNNLPRLFSSFIGREREMADIRARLARVRLLTVTGMGGTGKTRIALQTAAEVAEEYPDGVFRVELAEITDPAQAAFAVADVLAVTQNATEPIQKTLIAALKPRTLLLLLDNCEHLTVPCADLANTLLRACPNLKILATSREPLDIDGESVYLLPTLSFPQPSDKNLREKLETSPAAQLFLERASSIKPDFVLTDKNLTAIAQICKQLDGIPLALELAVPRLRSLSVDELAKKLAERFKIVTGGSRSALPHQQTLRALVDWSYEPLPDTEKTLFASLSVFVGGWTLDAAETVCVGGVVEQWEILDLLTHLIEKSLVIAEEQKDGTTRYRMLETLREYSHEKFVQFGAEAICEQHLQWILAFAEEQATRLRTPERPLALLCLEQEHDNCRAALEWCLESTKHVEEKVRLGVALVYYWTVRGYLIEGVAWSERILGAIEGADPLAVAKLLNGVGMLYWRRGEFAYARQYVENSLKLYEAQNDADGMDTVCGNLGLILADMGEFEKAAELLERSLNLRRAYKNVWSIANGLNNLGLLEFNRGHHTKARQYWTECAALRRTFNEPTSLAETLHNLCLVAMAQGNYDVAQRLEEESLGILRELDTYSTIAYIIHNMGDLAYLQRQPKEARPHYAEALTLFEQQGDQWGICASHLRLGNVALLEGDRKMAWQSGQKALALAHSLEEKRLQAEALELLAGVHLTYQRYEEAARLVGLAEQYRNSLHSEREPFDCNDYTALHSALTEALVAEHFAAFCKEEQQFAFDDVATISLPFSA